VGQPAAETDPSLFAFLLLEFQCSDPDSALPAGTSDLLVDPPFSTPRQPLARSLVPDATTNKCCAVPTYSLPPPRARHLPRSLVLGMFYPPKVGATGHICNRILCQGFPVLFPYIVFSRPSHGRLLRSFSLSLVLSLGGASIPVASRLLHISEVFFFWNRSLRLAQCFRLARHLFFSLQVLQPLPVFLDSVRATQQAPPKTLLFRGTHSCPFCHLTVRPALVPFRAPQFPCPLGCRRSPLLGVGKPSVHRLLFGVTHPLISAALCDYFPCAVVLFFLLFLPAEAMQYPLFILLAVESLTAVFFSLISPCPS